VSAGGGGQLEIRALRAGDDLDAQADLSERAFGPRAVADRVNWRQLMGIVIEDGAFFGVFDAARPVGSALFFDMRQWWYGRPVAMAGVSSVKIAPEERGRGIGRRMMARLLDEIAARGFPLSVLYPATMPLYRSLGWELAGGRYSVVIPARSLRTLMPPDAALGATVSAGTVPPGTVPAGTVPAGARAEIRRAGPADAQAVIGVISRAHQAARDSGPLTWDAAAMAVNLARPGMYSYLCADGFTSYKWDNGNEELFVAGVRAASAQSLRGLWSVIASHASIARSVRVLTSPADPLWWLTQEPDADLRHREMWMLRVVDAPAAIAARGFPAAVALDVPLRINDQSRPANSGRWTLSVADGKGELLPAGPGTTADPLTVGARGLAALYAGTPLASLRLAGLAEGGQPGADPALDAAFAASPYLVDAF